MTAQDTVACHPECRQMVRCWEEAGLPGFDTSVTASILQLGTGLQCLLERACQVAKTQAAGLPNPPRT
ncbi:hypothetical protein EYF80_013919 [Liparis tanakae]|uniref:Uncharacterized protein n=1 Tax=Liparis tanakae TaxID=230148 RepID=A0A4Z2IEM4_9TELE|nr:hypothetical protein EYF80_013919 [Liparis tanakae]